MADRPRSERAGFTILELLVVIGVVGLLAALLVPAVQGARGAARQAQCLSHLHQIGIAAQNYEATWRVFPGQLLHDGSWSRQLLPHLEQPEDARAGIQMAGGDNTERFSLTPGPSPAMPPGLQ
jgi:prepilin-type N-terminal cleavage/methylation domain-containing protein